MEWLAHPPLGGGGGVSVCLLWETKRFESHRGSLTPMFEAFHMRGLTVPFLLHPTHIIYISFFLFFF